MKKIILFTALIFSINIFPQSTLALNKAIDLTLKNYPLLKQKEEEIKAAEYKTDGAKSFYYPQINGEISYTRIGPLQTIDAPGLGSFELVPQNNYNAHLMLQQTLYDFGRRASQINLDESYKQSAIDEAELLKSDLSFQTAVSFYAILFLQKSIAVKDTQMYSLQEHIKVINKNIKAGTATDYDMLSTHVKMSEVQNEKIELENELKTQMINLKKLTGISQDSLVDVSGNFLLPNNKFSIDSLIETAFHQRKEIQYAYDKEKSAELVKGLASSEYYPELNAVLDYGIKNGMLPNLDVLRGNWSAQVSLEIPIFNGFRTSNLEREAGANIKASEFYTAKIKSDIKAEIKQAFNNLKTDIKKFNTTQTQINYAQASFEKATIQYKNGVRTNLDLLDANTALAKARLQNLTELYKCTISSYLLKKAAGDIIW